MSTTDQDSEKRCNSPYHFDLEKLSGYGTDELNDAMQTILNALLEKQYYRGLNNKESYATQKVNQVLEELKSELPEDEAGCESHPNGSYGCTWYDCNNAAAINERNNDLRKLIESKVKRDTLPSQKGESDELLG